MELTRSAKMGSLILYPAATRRTFSQYYFVLLNLSTIISDSVGKVKLLGPKYNGSVTNLAVAPHPITCRVISRSRAATTVVNCARIEVL